MIERLEKVEKQNRRLKSAVIVGFVLLGIVSVVLIINQTYPKNTVEAERFVLLDKAGNVRAGLGVWEDGMTGLVIRDVNGKIRVKLGREDGEERLTGLTLFGEAENSRVELSVKDPRRRLGQYTQLRLGKSGTTESYIAMFVIEEPDTARIGNSEIKYWSHAQLHLAGYKQRIRLAVDQRGSQLNFSRMDLGTGIKSWDDYLSLDTIRPFSSGLTLYGWDQEPRVVLQYDVDLNDPKRGWPSLNLYGKEGTFLFTAP